MTSPAILNKIKYLLALTQSPNANEAATAQSLADRLIEKHNVTPEELESLKDPKPLYGENEKLFSTIGIHGWKTQLSLAVATHFDCLIVQEECVPAEGEHQFNYFVYGADEDVANTQYAYQLLADKVEEHFITKCMGKGPIYKSSYGEGMVESIKLSIQTGGMELPKKVEIKREQETIALKGDEVVKPKAKERPAEKGIDVRSQSAVKDITAYFNGMYDGSYLSLQDIIELANQNDGPEQLEDETQF
jgi:hypothetical protein